jgi:hypothetical protein
LNAAVLSEAFDVETVSQWRRTVVNYIMPDRRCTYDGGQEKTGT